MCWPPVGGSQRTFFFAVTFRRLLRSPFLLRWLPWPPQHAAVWSAAHSVELSVPPSSRWWSRTSLASRGRVKVKRRRESFAGQRWMANLAARRGRGPRVLRAVVCDHTGYSDELGGHARAAGEERAAHPVTLAHSARMLICTCCALLSRLLDRLRDSSMCLLHPFTRILLSAA